MTDCNQGLPPNDQGEQKRESLVTRLGSQAVFILASFTRSAKYIFPGDYPPCLLFSKLSMLSFGSLEHVKLKIIWLKTMT